MKEMILLFNPPAKEQLLKIRSALLPLHIRIQLIKPEQYNQPLGYLAGMKDISPERKLRRRGTPGYNVSLLFFKQQPSRSGSGSPSQKRSRPVPV